jgi:hypothetical protein
MADFITVETEGIAETMQMLADAPRVVVANGFLKAFQAAGDVIVEVLASNTPVKKEDTGGVLEQGELLESLMMDIELDSQFRGGFVAIGFGKNGNVADWLDGGHRLIGHAPNYKNLGSVAGNGFMRKSFDQSAEAAVDAFGESLTSTVTTQFPQGQVA